MRIFVAGQKAFGAAVLELAMRAGHHVAGVSSPPHASTLDTTGAPMPDRMRATAEGAGVPWMPAGTLRADTLPRDVDVIVAAHAHDFIGRATRLRARLGAIGFHPSLLPRHRGRDAVRWTVHMREPITGGSLYWLSDTIDGGDIAAQDWCHVRPGDTPEELWRRELFPIGLRLFARTLADLERGRVVRVPQDPALVTWEPSWSRAPLHRPELLQLGDGRNVAGLEVARDAAALHDPPI